ncbi:helix-turn-helix domain-containing protein [Kribbella sp. CA-293567]|uniref:helix-turn-helix domain-containing protein n=1 Tax=Kribbella sp. CA-293567 TaxID=3002436 RepID=UPI0022DD4287|nr:helix-turn-helix transcriptional regulator [Kribbella sp. CA-293567]WBQ04345.1 helix-turn-helix transcriptional regulator [Kribbella sp. CA-293567]
MTGGDRQPNDALRTARGALSQATLADQVNAAIYRATGRETVITAKSISDWERGWYSWPSADVRMALCEILGAPDAAALGFFKRRTRRAALETSPLVLPDLISGRGLVSVGSSNVVRVPDGRFFAGGELVMHHCIADEAGRGWLMINPSDGVTTSLRRTDRWSAVVTSDADGKYYVSDSRRFARQTGRRTNRQPVAAANVVDDLTAGIIWAVVNTDNALLADDAQIEASQSRLGHYVEQSASMAALNEVPDLELVTRHWLGSSFCSRHISRHVSRLAQEPFFWTREQSGEEASSWLLWNHKLDYLRYTSKRFAGMRRAFCVPEREIDTSPQYEKVLLLLTMALMEAFGITVELTTDSSLGPVEGFVIASEAIAANWLGGEELWHVDARPERSRRAAYQDLSDELAANSVIASDCSAARLEWMADYLGVSWRWFRRRCEELAVAGIDGIVQPRSRHLSTRGLDAAVRYVAHIHTIEGSCLARC